MRTDLPVMKYDIKPGVKELIFDLDGSVTVNDVDNFKPYHFLSIKFI